jgi:membrane fusion protein, multidrug efflux system
MIMSVMNTSFIKGILILSLILPLFLTSCKKKEAAPPPPAKVQVVQVLQTNVPIPMEYVGQTYGYKDIPIRARVDGFLTGMYFLEGSTVKKGQLLYTIDPEPLKAKEAEKLSALAAAQARLTRAESDLNRVRPLAAMNAVSQRDLDAATAEFESARAQVEAAQAEVKYADINLSYTTITSPLDGIIGMTQAKTGEYVGRAPNPIVLNEVSSIDSILVQFSISESAFLELIKMKKDKEANLSDSEKLEANKKAQITLILSDGSEYPHKGRFNFANRQVDPQTGTIMFQVSFPNPEQLLRPGLFARIKVVLEEIENGLLIPQRCVRELQGTHQVYVLNGNNEIELRNVELSVKVGGMWMIDSGLKAGETVVFEGLNLVRPGQKVQPEKVEIPKDLLNF